jgi:hypothetical protein
MLDLVALEPKAEMLVTMGLQTHFTLEVLVVFLALVVAQLR